MGDPSKELAQGSVSDRVHLVSIMKLYPPQSTSGVFSHGKESESDEMSDALRVDATVSGYIPSLLLAKFVLFSRHG